MMKKINIKYRIESFEQFDKNFQDMLNVFSEQEISHLEISLLMDTLSTKEIERITNCIARNKTFKEITNDTIYTFIVIVSPSRELAKILVKIRGLLSRIELVSSEENVKNVSETFFELQKKKLPSSLLIRELEFDRINSIYHKVAAMGASIVYEGTVPYNDNFLALFKEWVYDKKGCRINIFSDILSQILLDYWGTKCQYKSCMTKYFFVDANGKIFSCKDCKNEICSLSEIHSLDEIISHDNFISLLEQSIAKRENCKASCEYYEQCQGGCPVKSNDSISNCEDRNLFIVMKKISELMYQQICKSDYRILNPAVREMILSSAASNKLFEKGMVD